VATTGRNFESGTIVLKDGKPRKLMDVSKLNSMGWKASVLIKESTSKVYYEIKNKGCKQ